MFGLFKKEEIKEERICEFDRFIFNFLEVEREYISDTKTTAKIKKMYLEYDNSRVTYIYYNNLGSGTNTISLKEFYDFYIIDFNIYLKKQVDSMQKQITDIQNEKDEKEKSNIELAAIANKAVNELSIKMNAQTDKIEKAISLGKDNIERINQIECKHDIKNRTVEYVAGWEFVETSKDTYEYGYYAELCTECGKELKTFKSKKKALKREIEIKQEQLKECE